METQKSPAEKQTSPAATTPPPITSCRKKKNEQATFLEDVKDHIDEFINASMDEHKSCFKKTIQKVFLFLPFSTSSSLCYLSLLVTNCLVEIQFQLFVFVTDHVVEIQFQMFGMSKIVAERSSETKEVVSTLPLQTTVSD